MAFFSYFKEIAAAVGLVAENGINVPDRQYQRLTRVRNDSQQPARDDALQQDRQLDLEERAPRPRAEVVRRLDDAVVEVL